MIGATVRDFDVAQENGDAPIGGANAPSFTENSATFKSRSIPKSGRLLLPRFGKLGSYQKMIR